VPDVPQRARLGGEGAFENEEGVGLQAVPWVVGREGFATLGICVEPLWGRPP